MPSNPCLPLPGPDFGYLCENEVGDPVVEEYVTVDGTPVVQGPLRFCGTGERVCLNDTVSACISDTDGEPTTYGPLPDAPDPEDVTGRSPRFSRVRINRTGLAALPYSSTYRPDQLLDLVLDGGEEGVIEVDYNPTTGRFTLPPYPTVPVIPDQIPTYRVVEAISLNVPGASAPDTRIETAVETITNPSPDLDMRVMIHATVQVGIALLNGGAAVIQPQLYYSDVGWGGAVWEQQTWPNYSGGSITGGENISFVDSKVISPGGSLGFALGVTVANFTVGSIFTVSPVSLHIAADGVNTF